METKLQRIRKQKGHTLKQAGQAAGIASTTLHLLETGKRLPSQKTLQKLTEYYKLDEAEIIKIYAILRERRLLIERIDRELMEKLSG